MVATQIFLIFTPITGEMIQFDEYIFQMGWFNHRPDLKAPFSFGSTQPWVNSQKPRKYRENFHRLGSSPGANPKMGWIKDIKPRPFKLDGETRKNHRTSQTMVGFQQDLEAEIRLLLRNAI